MTDDIVPFFFFFISFLCARHDDRAVILCHKREVLCCVST